MTKVLTMGYGNDWYRIQRYVWFALKIASEERVSAIIFTGGDTTDKSTGGPWEFKTEAETMKALAKAEIALTGKRMRILLEKNAYDTLSNLENSKRLIDDENEEIVIVCNEAHLLKVKMAAIKVFGLKAACQRISFRPFPLTTGKIENLGILAKTIPEVAGYFFPPWGVCVSYLQYRWRTGRNDQIGFLKGFWQFCQRFRTGELI